MEYGVRLQMYRVVQCNRWAIRDIYTYVDTISLLAKLFPTDDDFDEKKSIQYPVQFNYWLIWWIDSIGNV